MEDAMTRYFKVQPQSYEQTRLALDQAAGFGPHETVYEPLATAPLAPDANALIGIRAEHCELEPYASAVASLLGSNAATEITQAEYEAALPQTQGGPQQ
jgi:hypothetical protein